MLPSQARPPMDGGPATGSHKKSFFPHTYAAPDAAGASLDSASRHLHAGAEN